MDRPFRRGRRRLARRLLPMAAALAVMLFSMIAAQALGFDVFGALARWTDETFRFVSGAAEDDSNLNSEMLHQAVQEAFDSCGVTIPAPLWFPKGTELVGDIDVAKSQSCSAITCDFSYGDNYFGIVLHQYNTEDSIPDHTFEKDALNVEEYTSNGRLFYILSNLTDAYAVHLNDQTSLVISGELSLETIKRIIDSIGE